MRSLERNLQAVWYSLYTGKVEKKDSNGLYTGESTDHYSTPVKVMMNVSPSRKTVEIEMFGIANDYTKTMVTHDMNCPIVESTRLWVGVNPSDNVPHNYTVKRVGKSLNSISYTIKEVDVNA